MRSAILVGVVALGACGHHAVATRVVRHGHPPGWMLPRAERAARLLGDPHPERIELFAAGRTYRMRLWGSFRCEICSRPYGAAAPTGRVATYVYRGHTGSLSSFSLSPRAVAAAADETAPVVREWRRELAKGARLDPGARFPSPPVSVLRRRLAQAARRFGLTVDLVEMRRPRQLAPQIRLRTASRHRLARSLGAIMDAVDPPPSDRRVYEGILIEAVDEHAVPFAIAWNALRGHVAGGQWASAPDLYPFAHG